MFYLGIDQHAKQLTINLRDSTGDAVPGRQVSRAAKNVLELFEALTRYDPSLPREARNNAWILGVIANQDVVLISAPW
ncbi:MAG: hypothetical protein AAFN77_24750, partial [Planctomycetota bacterium]